MPYMYAPLPPAWQWQAGLPGPYDGWTAAQHEAARAGGPELLPLPGHDEPTPQPTSVVDHPERWRPPPRSAAGMSKKVAQAAASIAANPLQLPQSSTTGPSHGRRQSFGQQSQLQGGSSGGGGSFSNHSPRQQQPLPPPSTAGSFLPSQQMLQQYYASASTAGGGARSGLGTAPDRGLEDIDLGTTPGGSSSAPGTAGFRSGGGGAVSGSWSQQPWVAGDYSGGYAGEYEDGHGSPHQLKPQNLLRLGSEGDVQQWQQRGRDGGGGGQHSVSAAGGEAEGGGAYRKRLSIASGTSGGYRGSSGGPNRRGTAGSRPAGGFLVSAGGAGSVLAVPSSALPGVGATKASTGLAAALGARWEPTHQEVPDPSPALVNEARLSLAADSGAGDPTPSARLAYSRKPRVTSYVPHSLADYKASAIALGLGIPDPDQPGTLKYTTLGKLGPDLADPAVVAKREARERARAYGLTASAMAAQAAARRAAAAAAAAASGGGEGSGGSVSGSGGGSDDADEGGGGGGNSSGGDSGGGGLVARRGGSALPPPGSSSGGSGTPIPTASLPQPRRAINIAGDLPYDAAKAAAARERARSFAQNVPKPKPRVPVQQQPAQQQAGDAGRGAAYQQRFGDDGGGGGDAGASSYDDAYHVPELSSLDAQHNALRSRTEAIRRELAMM
jgi:hypothetical protein